MYKRINFSTLIFKSFKYYLIKRFSKRKPLCSSVQTSVFLCGKIFFLLFITLRIDAQSVNIDSIIQNPPESSKPWVFWYWMKASVSREGITTDLEAMKEAGIGGAYLFTIKGPTNPPLIDPPVEQLTPEWWEMIRFAVSEADRLGLKVGFHVSDGFALAGGPWIKPELSMQKVVWSETTLEGGKLFNDTLKRPENYKGFYEDIAVYAFPATNGSEFSTENMVPEVTTSNLVNAQFLVDPKNSETFKSDKPCWIQYKFEKPFTCRTIAIKASGLNYQSQRLIVETSSDGKEFQRICQLEAPRHGWQDANINVTHSIESTTAKYFRFIYDKSGSEPGSEDLDAAKWKPALKIKGIYLSGTPRISQYEGKSGAVWRLSKQTTNQLLPDSICVEANKIINLTQYLDSTGRIQWNVPAGKWTILRMGHTSTGQTNATGGSGKGLECDKFNPVAIKLQFDNWFGETFRKVDTTLASRVIKAFHVDSWECGSQNWSPVFRDEFKKRRGYDLIHFMPAMAGIVISNAETSEKFLYDIRQTISELVADNFYVTLAKLAKQKGCSFSAESVAPTMTSDGMLHYKEVDWPMGEFWLRSPTHDKPNDMFDAISGAHIYGKNIVQAEAFTELRMAWDEYPGMLKTLLDRNLALGINRMVLHVFTHNPWLDRKPGMTLDAIGLFFQPNQTWWKPGKAFIAYTQRCQALLQLGHPVADIAMFTGEEIPRRSILPDRLVPFLPGIFGKEIVESEARRLKNEGEPLREMPDGVTHSANMADPENWVDPLMGYKYDCINPDALLNLAKVNNGNIELPGGSKYKLLIIPGNHPMNPDGAMMSVEVAGKLYELVNAGATILFSEKPTRDISFNNNKLNEIIDKLWDGNPVISNDQLSGLQIWKIGKGTVIYGKYTAESFDPVAIERDVSFIDSVNNYVRDIAWTHRSGDHFEIYFISNQQEIKRKINASFRVNGFILEIYNPLTGEIIQANQYKIEKDMTSLALQLEPNAAVFIIFKKPNGRLSESNGKNWIEYKTIQTIDDNWKVKFDENYRGPKDTTLFKKLTDWSQHFDSTIRYYSGTASYVKDFTLNHIIDNKQKIWLNIGDVKNIAEVWINDKSCGVAWSYPYQVDITNAIKPGKNKIRIDVTNTWANRLIGDHRLPEKDRFTWTTAPFRLEGKPLLKSGLIGPIKILIEDE
jgi:hypothetical protein